MQDQSTSSPPQNATEASKRSSHVLQLTNRNPRSSVPRAKQSSNSSSTPRPSATIRRLTVFDMKTQSRPTATDKTSTKTMSSVIATRHKCALSDSDKHSTIPEGDAKTDGDDDRSKQLGSQAERPAQTPPINYWMVKRWKQITSTLCHSTIVWANRWFVQMPIPKLQSRTQRQWRSTSKRALDCGDTTKYSSLSSSLRPFSSFCIYVSPSTVRCW